MSAGDPRDERFLSYVAKADDARQKALKAKDPLAKRSFEMVAAAWQQLAEQVARTRDNRP